MHDTPLTRRAVLGLAAMAALGVATAVSAQTVCLDMASLPASQKGMRKALGFQETSSDPKKKCATCSFFTAKGAACGTCMLLSGGVVNPTSVCTSWAAKG
ncbi:MAG TPA: high-potential iron-sulfur protein [Sphingobium sp.]